MNAPPDLQQTPPLPQELVEAGLNGNLVLFVGAGLSMLAGLPSWGGLANGALEFLRKQGVLNYSKIDQLKSLDPKTQLSIARIIAEQEEISLDLSSSLGSKQPSAVYDAINQIGCACVTTNYDELLAPTFREVGDSESSPVSIKAKAVNRVSDRTRFFSKLLDEPGTVVHLHGAISSPESMILTTKDYLEHYDDNNVKHFLGELFAKKTVLFIGYGLAESEILEHILRRGSVTGRPDRRRFALQGYFRNQDYLYEKLHAYYEKSFGVHLVGFMRDFRDYSQQEDILKLWCPQIRVARPPLVDDLRVMAEVLDGH